jgi:hypothetical protein
MVEYFGKLSDLLKFQDATFGNINNTFSGEIQKPVINDYIFYRANTNQVKFNFSSNRTIGRFLLQNSENSKIVKYPINVFLIINKKNYRLHQS